LPETPLDAVARRIPGGRARRSSPPVIKVSRPRSALIAAARWPKGRRAYRRPAREERRTRDQGRGSDDPGMSGSQREPLLSGPIPVPYRPKDSALTARGWRPDAGGREGRGCEPGHFLGTLGRLSHHPAESLHRGMSTDHFRQSPPSFPCATPMFGPVAGVDFLTAPGTPGAGGTRK
jgi:hypothetical protein